MRIVCNSSSSSSSDYQRGNFCSRFNNKKKHKETYANFYAKNAILSPKNPTKKYYGLHFSYFSSSSLIYRQNKNKHTYTVYLFLEEEQNSNERRQNYYND